MVTPRLRNGIDWLSGTVMFDRGTRDIIDNKTQLYAALLLESERRLGNDAQPKAMLGYDGIQCGQVFAGRRDDGWMLQTTGQKADERFEDLSEKLDNITRVDLQVTEWSDSDPVRRILADRRAAIAHKERMHSPLRIRQVTEHKNGATLYLGSPASDRMIRIYDKGAESKDSYFDKALRVELQVRKKGAGAVVKTIKSQSVGTSAVASIVRDALASKGVHRKWNCTSLICHISPRTLRKESCKFRWLASQVRPTIEWAKRTGTLKQALESLGLTHDDLIAVAGEIKLRAEREVL